MTSYRIHPKLHISDAWSYCLSIKETSGALYHLEPTCRDMHLLSFLLLCLSFLNLLETKFLKFYSTFFYDSF